MRDIISPVVYKVIKFNKKGRKCEIVKIKVTEKDLMRTNSRAG